MACSSSVRGIWAGGSDGPINSMEYVTIATTGNGTNFGNLTTSRGRGHGIASLSLGIFAGGTNASDNKIIASVIIATTGNAVSFGNLITGRQHLAGCSDSHGGL